jgi:hypothetical protein
LSLYIYGALCLAGQPSLVPAQPQQKADALGNRWDFSGQGDVQRQTPGGFNYAQRLLVNGQQFSPEEPMMVSGGSEYLLGTTQIPNLLVGRRVKLDSKSGSVRFVDSFQNLASAPLELQVDLHTSLRNSAAAVLTDDTAKSSGSAAKPAGDPAKPAGGASIAKALANALAPAASGSPPSGSPMPGRNPRGQTIPLGDKGSGVAAVQSGTGQTSYLIYLAAPRSEVKPTVIGKGGTDFIARFSLIVPPQQTVVILHGFAQRQFQNMPDAKTLAKEFRRFQSPSWIADLPAEVKKAIVNGRGSSEEEPSTAPLLQAVAALEEECGVDRAKADVLVHEKQPQLTGQVRGEGLAVTTQFGAAAVPLDDVVLVVGGAGVDRAARVFLRNGEVLAGPIQWKGAALKSDSGVDVQLAPPQIDLLFLHADPRDGKPAQPGTVLVQTQNGDRLAIAPAGVKFSAVTSWGPIEVPFDQVLSLAPLREPQPIQRLALRDGSRWSVILAGPPLTLKSSRLGELKIAPSEIERLTAVERRGDEEEDEPERKPPFCRLVGENIAVGPLQTPALEVLTPGGPTSVELAKLIVMELDEGKGNDPWFTFRMVGGGEISGRLKEPSVPLRAFGKVCRVPAHQLVAYRQAADPPGTKKRVSAKALTGHPAPATRLMPALPGWNPYAPATLAPPPTYFVPGPGMSVPIAPGDAPVVPGPAADPAEPDPYEDPFAQEPSAPAAPAIPAAPPSAPAPVQPPRALPPSP